MRVNYMGLLRNVVGSAEEEEDLPAGSRVRDLLSALQDRHGDAFRNALFTSTGGLRPLVRVFIGDQDIMEMDGMDTEIDPASGVCILLLNDAPPGG